MVDGVKLRALSRYFLAAHACSELFSCSAYDCAILVLAYFMFSISWVLVFAWLLFIWYSGFKPFTSDIFSTASGSVMLQYSMTNLITSPVAPQAKQVYIPLMLEKERDAFLSP